MNKGLVADVFTEARRYISAAHRSPKTRLVVTHVLPERDKGLGRIPRAK